MQVDRIKIKMSPQCSDEWSYECLHGWHYFHFTIYYILDVIFFISSKIKTVILTETLFRYSNFLPVYSAASISVFGILGKLNNRSPA